jgi:opacity protein-like surface antigen
MVARMSCEGKVVMGWSRTLAVSAMVLTIPGAGAFAADMPGFPPLPTEEPSSVVEFTSAWYIRGDIGYRFDHVGEASDLITSYPDTSSTDAYVAGGGFGYKWNWLRLDITGDYGGRSTLDASNASGSGSFTTKVDTYSVMFNAYADLGTWWGITPYIGAGIGKTRVSTLDYTTNPPALLLVPPANRWNTAWAVMAGFSYNLSYNLLVDVGYRHIDMGDAAGGPTSLPTVTNDLTGDEIRIGLRYNVD